MNFLIGALGVVFAFGLVVFIHEFGHFIVAKWNGVKVERFSFGLGPELIGVQWGETRYCIAWIPLGGEVRMAGDMEPGQNSQTPRDPREFFAKAWYRRCSIVVAGPVMNYVLAFVVFFFVFLLWGNPKASIEPVIGDVVEGLPAHSAGLVKGDRFVSVGGGAVSSWPDVAEKIHQSPGTPLALIIKRDENEVRVTVTPQRDSERGVGLIGITPMLNYSPMPFKEALYQGAFQTIFWTEYTLKYLGEKIWKREKPELSGPLGIASVISKSAQSGVQDYFFLIALISLGIGLFNLFPIPLLDGGHLVFYLWEGIFRKPVGKKAVQTANAVGLSILLGILVFATYSDARRMWGPSSKKSSTEVRP